MAKQKPPSIDPLDMLRSRARKTVTVSMCMGYDEADALEQARKEHQKAVTGHDSARKAREEHEARIGELDPDDPADYSRRVTAEKTTAALSKKFADAELLLADAEADLAAAEEAAAAVSIEFRLRAIGRVLIEQLRLAHPPTDEQKQKYAEVAAAAGLPKVQQIGPDWNPDTYPPAFLAAAMAEPSMTVEQVDELIWSNDAVTQYERERLFHAAVEAQNVTNTVT